MFSCTRICLRIEILIIIQSFPSVFIKKAILKIFSRKMTSRILYGQLRATARYSSPNIMAI